MAFVSPFLSDLVFFLPQFFGLISEICSFLKVLVRDSVLFFLVQLLDFFVDFLQIWWTCHGAQTNSCASLIDDIDRFIRKASGCDVSLTHFDGSDNSIVGELHTMMFFVTSSEPFEDFNGLIFCGRFYDDFLKTTSQSIVFFDVLSIFVECGSTDALNFASGKSRLQYVGSVNCTFCSTSSHERVKFVDEENRVLYTPHFSHHCLDALFELAAVLRSSNHHGQVEYNDSLLSQNLWYFAFDDSLCESFDDGGFTNTSFSKQNRIILGSSTKDLSGSLNFPSTTDDGVQFTLFCQFRQVSAKAVQGRSFALPTLSRAGWAFTLTTTSTAFANFRTFQAVSEQVQDFFANVFQLEAQIHQNLCSNALLLS